MIENVIFDLGNVLLNFKPIDFLKRFVKDEKKITSFTSKVILTDTWLELDRGLITVENAIKKLQAKFPEENEIINLFFNHWMEMFTPIHRNIKIVKNLKKKGYHLYVLSNFIKEACIFVNEKYEFFQCFEGAVYSFQIHHVKPEIEIYEHLIRTYDLKPECSVFLDDHLEFLIPARKLGMEVIEVKQNTDIEQELMNLDIKL